MYIYTTLNQGIVNMAGPKLRGVLRHCIVSPDCALFYALSLTTLWDMDPYALLRSNQIVIKIPFS